jgi:hypothetical protein
MDCNEITCKLKGAVPLPVGKANGMIGKSQIEIKNGIQFM